MSSRPTKRNSPTIPNELNGGQQAALLILLAAWNFAHEANVDVWNFAEEISDLRTVGLSNADFRRLIQRELVCHAEEISNLQARRRRFRRIGPFALPSNTCFVLTDQGLQLAQQIFTCKKNGDCKPSSHHDSRPVWNPQKRELRVGNILVKRYRRPAPNQELVLQVFEEEGWPHRIDDPLPRPLGRDPVQCLHDTINHLNRNQLEALIHFSGDGNGCGICWTLTLGPLSPDWHQNGTILKQQGH
jgi:hypothetical protein